MDETRRESIKPLIYAWMQERLRSLQDQVLFTWEEGMGRLRPDDAMLQKILGLAGAAPAVQAAPEPIVAERDLGIALDLLEHSNNQGEVLRHLLEGLKPFAERCAIFVVKPGMVTLYAQRGFGMNAAHHSHPVAPPPELDDLIQGRLKTISRPGPAYKALLDPLSRFEAPDVCILPLCLRRKPVGILLVDSGLKPRLGTSQIVRALARATEAALSFQAVPKEERGAPPPAPAPVRPVPGPVTVPVQPVPPPKPAQAQAPMAMPPGQPVVSRPQAPAATVQQPPVIPAQAPARPVAPTPPPAPPLPRPLEVPVVSAATIIPNVTTIPLPDRASGPHLDPKLCANAERSARVLIGDIELYSPAKVASGKTQKNLYAILKDELERSRASFVDRYGADVEEQHHVFFNTLVQQLCDGDPSRLGPNPWIKRMP